MREDADLGEHWTYGLALPEGFPLSHAGLATDGKFLFVVSGQPGPACEPATKRAWAFDLEQMTWEPMAPLPAARYAPLAEYVDGNLHVISGAIEDREAAMTMDPAKCCGTYWVHKYLFRYDPKREEWMRLADMPFGSSHIEAQTIVIGGRILVLGGTADRDFFVDKIQEYDPAKNCWRQLRRLPAGRKGGVVWECNGVVHFNEGQIAPDKNKPYDRAVVSETMTAEIKRGFWSLFV